MLAKTNKGFNESIKRIEPMAGSAVLLALHLVTLEALPVMADPSH